MVSAYTAAPDVHVLTSNFPIPGFGFVPVNAFVLKGREPLLVDTGTIVERPDFMRALETVIDPRDLRWIWLTHTDPDHTGSLHQLLDENPRIRVITTFLGMGIMGLTTTPLPPDRVYFLNPGETITIGDRTLTAVKPPVFDNPCTTGFHESRTGALFSADCFGALLQSVPRAAEDLSAQELLDGQVAWATVDAPWLQKVDKGMFLAELQRIRQMAPTAIFSNHLPPARGHMIDRFVESLSAAPGAHPFVGPNQAAFEEMLKQMAAPA